MLSVKITRQTPDYLPVTLDSPGTPVLTAAAPAGPPRLWPCGLPGPPSVRAPRRPVTVRHVRITGHPPHRSSN
jgi:hypothetical protein